jgi:hypothetical protein
VARRDLTQEYAVARLKTNLDEKEAWMRDQYSADSVPVAGLPGPSGAPAFAERHYTVSEIAELWNLSPDALRKMFQNEPGVLVLGGAGAKHKRRYLTLRIPESVLRRVHRRMTNS